jgi:hypothetical protein
MKFWKNRPVRFGFSFISLKSKKPNWTKPKPKTTRNKTEPNRFEPVFVQKTEPNRNRFRFFFFSKNSVWLHFFIKTESNRKWLPLLSIILSIFLTQIIIFFRWIFRIIINIIIFITQIIILRIWKIFITHIIIFFILKLWIIMKIIILQHK